jgi:fatty acid desaturase
MAASQPARLEPTVLGCRLDAHELLEVLHRLEQLDARRWLGACAVDWAVIVATFVAVAAVDHPLVLVVAVFVLGSRQHALGALFHDAAHGLVSRHRLANDVLGNVLSAHPLGLTLGGYRRYHLAHHAHLGSDRDPENHHKAALPHWRLPASPASVAAQFLGDLAGGGLPHIWAAGRLTKPVRALEAVGLGAFWVAALGIAYACDALWVPLLWLVAVATVFWSGVRLRIFTEHLGTRDTHRIHVPPLLAHAIMPHHIGLHWEHHHFPRVPFWRLAELRRVIAGPPVVAFGALWRALVHARPLASGAVAAAVAGGDDAATVVAPAPPRRRLRFAAAHVALPLAAGFAVYALFRAPASAAELWLGRHGLALGLPRLPLRAFAQAVVDAVPSFAWTYAFTATQVAVWWDGRSGARAAWLGLTLAVAVAWELGQALALLPGTFSIWDLLATVVGFAIAAQHGAMEPTEGS